MSRPTPPAPPTTPQPHASSVPTAPTTPHPTVPLPDLTAPGTVTVTTWSTDGPAATRRVLGAVAAVWIAEPETRPLAYAVCVTTDGTALLHYARWPDDRSAASGPVPYEEAVRATAPEAERLTHGAYHRYRTGPRTEGDDRTAGCLVAVTIGFDAPDAHRQRDWTDAMFAATAGDPYDRAGVIAAHFHTAADGVGVLNLAEWESEAAHRAAFEGAPDTATEEAERETARHADREDQQEDRRETEQEAEREAAWARVLDYPGLTGSQVVRHLPLLTLPAESTTTP
ncbi:hypothetical protein JNUCC64_19075 [Streptomyces sp. JNUCC 64]